MINLKLEIIRSADKQIEDLTYLIDYAASVQITKEFERDTFEYVIPDCSITVNDFDGRLYDIFFNEPVSTVFKIIISKDGSIRFRGFIKREDAVRDLASQKIVLQAYSVMRAFWDLCKTTKAIELFKRAYPEYGNGYWLFSDMINLVTSFWQDRFIASQIIIDIDVYIRNYRIVDKDGNEIIPGEAYSVLWEDDNYTLFNYFYNAENTIEQFFKAIAYYHNAIWIYRNDSDTIKLVARDSIQNDLGLDLSDKVYYEGREIIFSDQKKYDAIKLSTIYTLVEPPIYVDAYSKRNSTYRSSAAYPMYAYGFIHGIYRFLVTAIKSDGTESTPSTPIRVTLEPLPVTGTSDLISETYYFQNFIIRTPDNLPDGYTRFRLYMFIEKRFYKWDYAKSGSGYQEVYLEKPVNNESKFMNKWVKVIDADAGKSIVINYDTSFTIYFTKPLTRPLAEEKPVVSESSIQSMVLSNSDRLFDEALRTSAIYIGYNESSLEWTILPAINNNGENFNEVLDITPDISFSESERGKYQADSSLLYYFFGKRNFKDLKNIWQSLMQTKRLVKVDMIDCGLDIGDAFTLDKITNLRSIKKLLVKKIEEDAITDKTSLELITIPENTV